MIVGRNVPVRKSGRKFGGETAREMLEQAEFGRGREAIFLTAGQFSSVDWIDALLGYTGEADGVIATWTAAAADLDRVEKWIGGARLSSCSWIVDRSFPNRQPAICDSFRKRFGDESDRGKAKPMKQLKMRGMMERGAVMGVKTAAQIGLK